jgi:YNFM family putative membrane transporter
LPSLVFGSMALGAVFNLLAAVAPYWPLLLAARLVEGLVLGGFPAVAMAYLADEMHSRDLGKAVGLYVAGTAFGGMTGRFGMGVVTDPTSWRMAMAGLSVLDLAAAIGFTLLLPVSRRIVPQPGFDLGQHGRQWADHLLHRDLLRLFAIGFLAMSVFVTIFN